MEGLFPHAAMGPVERMVRRQFLAAPARFRLARFQSSAPHHANIAGNTNEPMTVTIGEIDGLDALIIPPIPRRMAMVKQISDPMRMQSSWVKS